MCIIILNKKGLIKKETLKTCFENNPHGMGLMYSANGKLNTYKELKDFNLFYDYYATVRKEFKKSNIGLHFRIKTHGDIDIVNTHPFIVNDKLAFMHNGIIDINIPTGSQLSDTAIFNERILKNLPNEFYKNFALMELLSKYTTGSKLLFLNSKNQFFILNERMGTWSKDNWYSNYSYCDYVCSIPAKTTATAHMPEYDDYCTECGRVLRTDYEYTHGMCHYCLNDYSMTDIEENRY